MNPHVLFTADDSQILNAVVLAVPVDVMDVLITAQLSTKMLLHNEPMLVDPLPMVGELDIAKPVDITTALPSRTAVTSAGKSVAITATVLAVAYGDSFWVFQE